MATTVKLSELRSLIESFDYPISRDAAREESDGVTVLYADGEESLATVVARTNQERYETAEDLEAEIFNTLPIEAVGEPGQSEGEG